MDKKTARKFMGKIEDIASGLAKYVSNDSGEWNDMVANRALKSLQAACDHLEDIEESYCPRGQMLKEDKGNVIKDVSVEILDMDLDDPDKDFEVIDDFDIDGEYDNVEDVMVKAAGRVMACNKSSIYHCEIAALDGDSGQEIPLKNVMDKPGSYEVDIFRRHSGNREYRINIFFDVE